MLKALIVEDELPAQMRLIEQLRLIPEVMVVGTARTGDEAVAMIDGLRPDLVFLDNILLDTTGLAVLERVQYRSKIIFTTAHREMAVDAFNHAAVDYLLKPFTLERLKASISRIKSSRTKNVLSQEITFDKLVVKVKKGTSFLAYSDIVYITSQDRVSEAWDGQRFYECGKSLQELEELLPKRQFVRLHRKYIVGIEHIDTVSPWFNGKVMVMFKDAAQTQLSSSRSGWKRLKSILGMAST